MQRILTKLLLTVALLAPWASQAQTATTLTVADSTAYTSYLPIIGSWMDDYQRTQTLYPDSLLTSMRGNYIHKLTYYSTGSSNTTYSSTMTAKVGITESLTLGPDFDSTPLTTVWTGNIQLHNGLLEIEFNTPLPYPANGGNLLIEFYQAEGDNYLSTNFYGVTYGSSLRAYASYAASAMNFTPKTTFTYSSVSTICHTPTDFVATSVLATGITLHWSDTAANSWNLAYDTIAITNFDNVSSEPYYDDSAIVTGLTSNTHYYFYLQSDCGTDGASTWIGPLEITTNSCDNGCNYHLQMVDSYGDGWNGGYLSYMLNGTLQSTTYTCAGSSANADLYVCPGMTLNLIYNAGQYDSEVSFTLTNMTNDVLYNCTDASALSANTPCYTGVTSCSAGCMMPNQFVATGFHTTSIDLSWNERGDATQWNITYATSPISDFSGVSTIVAYDTAYTLTGLDSNTTYYIYVQSDCGSETSGWVLLQASTTACEGACQISVVCTSTYPDENFWNYGICSITIIQNNQLLATLSNSGTVNVCPGDSISFTYSTTYPAFDVFNAWTVYDRFGTPLHPTTAGVFDTIKMITDCLAPDCPAPQNLTFTGTASGSQSLSWTEMGEASSWNVAYGTAMMDSTVSNMTIVNASDPYITITGLSNDSAYYYYVQADCGGNESYWAGPIMGTPNSYVLEANATDTIYMCGGHVYDNGGATGNYSDSQNSYLTIYPTDNTMNISLSGTQWLEGSSWDWLKIYDGVGTSGTLLFTSEGASDSRSTGMAVSATSTNGPLTIYFKTDGSGNGNGFDLAVQCFDMNCTAVDSLQATAYTDSSISISWVGDENINSYRVKWSTSVFNFADTDVDSLDVNTSSVTLTGLSANTIYYISVATDCGNAISNAITIFQRTACGTLMLPYTDNFDSYSSGSMVPCWSSQAGNNYIENYSYRANSGINSIHFQGPGTIVSPLIPIPGNQIMLSCALLAENATSSGTMHIGFTTDPVTLSDYVEIQAIQPTTTYTTYNDIAFGSASADTGYVVFKQDSAASPYYYWWLDDVTIEAMPSCMHVSNITANNITSTSVDLTWTPNSSTSWNLVYSTTPITDFSNVSSTAVNALPFTVSGLTAGTSYYFYVQSDCGNGVYSSWEGTLQPITTALCDTTCDITIAMAGDYTDSWSYGNYSVAVYQQNLLIGSAAIANGYTDTAYIGICPGDSVHFVWNGGGYYEAECSFDIIDHTGDVIFTCNDASTLGDNFFSTMGDCSAVTCPAVTDVHATSTGATELTIDWTDATTSALGWIVEYGNTGFAHGSGTTLSATAHPVAIANLDTLTTYDIYVRTICAAGDSSRWSNVATLTTSLCNSSVMMSTGEATGSIIAYPVNNYYGYTLHETLISGSELTDINGIHAISYLYTANYPSTEKNDVTIWLQPTGKVEFSDNSDMVSLDTTIAVQVYSGALNCSTGWNTFVFDNVYTWTADSASLLVIVDDNSNGYDGSAYTFGNVADTLYRAISYYNDNQNPDPLDPASFTGSGKSRFNSRPAMRLISCGGSICDAPVGVMAQNVSYNEATIAWSGSSNSYETSMKFASESEWNPATIVTSSTTTLTNLQPATTYNFRVRTVCEDTYSDWCMITFTTDSLPCFAPTSLTYSDVTLTGATFSWTATGIETQWQLHVWNTSTDEVYTVGNNPATIDGLAQNTTYQVAVSALCGDTIESDYSDTIQFTTLTCSTPTDATASNVSSTTTTISWNGSADSYALEYGVGAFGEGQGSTVEVSGTSYTISGLEPSTQYSALVRAKCDDVNLSGWSERVVFTTASGEGIDAISGLDVKIYPNPTTTSTTITLNGVNGEVSIAIVDMNGRTVRQTTLNCEGDCAHQLEVSGISTGAYIVHISADGIDSVRRLVVK